jgi:hypothetical protein
LGARLEGRGRAHPSRRGQLAAPQGEDIDFVIARSTCDDRVRQSPQGEGGSNPFFLCFVSMDCFAEPVIGRAFARPVGSQ